MILRWCALISRWFAERRKLHWYAKPAHVIGANGRWRKSVWPSRVDAGSASTPHHLPSSVPDPLRSHLRTFQRRPLHTGRHASMITCIQEITSPRAMERCDSSTCHLRNWPAVPELARPIATGAHCFGPGEGQVAPRASTRLRSMVQGESIDPIATGGEHPEIWNHPAEIRILQPWCQWQHLAGSGTSQGVDHTGSDLRGLGSAQAVSTRCDGAARAYSAVLAA